MITLLFRKKPIRILVFIFCLILVLFFFKEAGTVLLIKRFFKTIFPGAEIRIRGLSVGFGSLDIRRFDIQSQARAPFYVVFENGSAFFKFLPHRFLTNPLFAIQEGHLSLPSGTVETGMLEGVVVDFSSQPLKGYIEACGKTDRIVFQKIKVGNLTGKMRVYGSTIAIGQAQATLFEGNVSGTGTMHFSNAAQTLSFQARLDHIAIADLMEALGAKERMSVTGAYSGDVRIFLKNGQIGDLSGELRSKDGGEFILKDSSLLNQKDLQGQAANIVVENLKNYHYDIGIIKIRNIGQDIRIDISLSGPTGQRNLELVWHTTQD